MFIFSFSFQTGVDLNALKDVGKFVISIERIKGIKRDDKDGEEDGNQL